MISAELERLIARSYQLGFRNIVAHQWTGSYLLKQYGRHHRKALRIASNLTRTVTMDWVGGVIWGSPIVALAPPYTLRRIKHNDVFVRECSSRTSPYILQSVSVGALEAMISFRQTNEIEKWNPV